MRDDQPAVLDEKGRCCGRKPLAYKGGPYTHRHKFCSRCDREFDFDLGTQVENWAWKKNQQGLFYRVR